MRIAYLLQMAELDTENGISKKVAMQVRSWIAAGHAVQVFSLARTTRLWPEIAKLPVALVPRGNAFQRFARSLQLCRRIAGWSPDVIYFRYAYHSPGLPELFRQIPTAAEINSHDVTEYALTLSRAKQLYHQMTRERVLRPIRAFVPVTHELAERFARFGRPAEVIGNSITFDEFVPLPPARDGPLRWVFAGSAGTPWHGLDRVTDLSALFPEIATDIIGCTEADWRRCVGPGQRRPHNLAFHGPLERSGYEPLMRAATAALGTLGLYRKQMHEACPLKVREYLAFGLPVIAGYRDTDIPAGADYFLQLPNDSSPLAPHRARIAAWLEQWRGRRVPRAAIRHLDTGEKEQRRLAFLSRIAGGPAPPNP